MHPIRFWTTLPEPIEVGSDWQGGLRRLEDLGFDAVVMPDHFTSGWAVEPMVALTAAAMCTTSLRLATGVLGNDYRHPVQTHRLAATLDVVSGGRLILGIGAGWLASDYQASGLALDPPGRRIDRLEEAVAIVKGLFAEEPLTFEGEHYTVRELQGLPRPAQQPRPPLMLGGGRPRMLRLAGREADIVGINTDTKKGYSGTHSILDLSAESVDQKVAWVREGIESAGRKPEDVALHALHWLVRVTATTRDAAELLEKVGARNQVDPKLLAASPSVLVGTVEQCVDTLLARRERYGFSYFQLDAGFAVPRLDSLAPVISRLAGA